MSRSKSGTAGLTIPLAARRSLLAFAVLATIAPCDDQSEDDVQAAEAGPQKNIAHAQRHERREESKEDEAEPHDGNDSDGERAAADERGPVQQEPHSRKRLIAVVADHHCGEDGSDDERREIADEETPRRAGGEERSGALSLPQHRHASDRAGQHGFTQPGDQPEARSPGGQRLGDRRRHQRGDPDREAAPSRNGRERAGALHRLADVAEIVDSVIAQGVGHGTPATSRPVRGLPARAAEAKSYAKVLYASRPVAGGPAGR